MARSPQKTTPPIIQRPPAELLHAAELQKLGSALEVVMESGADTIRLTYIIC
jgi:hypothetical protein